MAKEKLLMQSSIPMEILMPNYSGELDDFQMESLWRNAVQLTNDDLIGLHFGAGMQLAALSVVGTIIQSSNTVNDALTIAGKFVPLLTGLFTMELNEKDGLTVIRFLRNGDPDNFPVSSEQMGCFLVAFTMHELKGLLIQNLIPAYIGLPGYKEEDNLRYRSVCNCEFYQSDEIRVAVANYHLRTAIISANYELQSLLLVQLDPLINSSDLTGTYSRRVFSFLVSNSYLHSMPVDSVAGNFNMSVRSLQRRLKNEGVSYIQILEKARRSLAIKYITHSDSAVKQISFTLGYSEPSAFVRAFKKWTGMSPSRYRAVRARPAALTN